MTGKIDLTMKYFNILKYINRLTQFSRPRETRNNENNLITPTRRGIHDFPHSIWALGPLSLQETYGWLVHSLNSHVTTSIPYILLVSAISKTSGVKKLREIKMVT